MKDLTQKQESKRPYSSPLRQRQAEETRQRILAVAHTLLTTQGYVGMTMEAIAEAAEVSSAECYENWLCQLLLALLLQS